MARERVYLDWNATSPPLPAARDALFKAAEHAGNPSSVHAEGRAARAIVEEARAHVAALVGGPAEGVVFTSGGTEAANLALDPGFRIPGRKAADVLIVGAGEHVCVLEGHRFAPEATHVAPLTREGVLDLDALADLLARLEGRTPMLALQAVNNETGVIQPVAAAAALIHAQGGSVICDAAQAFGRAACGFAQTGADALLLSAHKIGGFSGAGALAMRDAQANIERPQARGGGQERRRRAGTENVSGIAAFGAAARHVREAGEEEAGAMRVLRDRLESRLREAFADVVTFGAGVERAANVSAFALSGAPAETLLIGLDLAGYAVSSGSACSSGKVRTSHVMAAMGVPPDLASGALRVSLGRSTRQEEIDGFVEAFAAVANRVRQRRRAA